MTPLLLILKSLIISQLFLLLVSSQDGKCPPSFDCGYFGEISFPFTVTQHPQCGILPIRGCDDKNPSAPKSIQLRGNAPSSTRFFNVSYVDRDTIAVTDDVLRRSLQSRNCKALFNNFTLPPTSPLASFYIKYNITMFRCNHSMSLTPHPESFHHYANCSAGYHVYYASFPNTMKPPGYEWPSSLAGCSASQVAVRDEPTDVPFDFLSPEIAIAVQLSDDCKKCLRHQGGRCQLDIHRNFHCAKEDKRLALKLGLGIGLPCIIITGLLITWYCKRHVPDFYSTNPYPESGSAYLGVPVFSYKDLQVATKSFDRSKELGEGGFGTVYYGKLKDGREVAVKRLFEHNYRRLEQFMNEIKILTRLRHRNLVSLYGCTSRHSRELLLVYEYIPNGTVASHLHGDLSKAGLLTWPIRMQIAIETATALAYLHASEIIHRDVKTNNILLDNTFCVKVADFGLSKLFPNDVTHVSTAPQGTPGYVDPEYHQCYRLTNKSDVYSFGVVLVELISSMPAVDMNRHKDEINLANLAVRRIQKSAIGELVDLSLGFESDGDVRRKMVLMAELAFRCLQRDKELRPSMDEVLEGLRRINNNYESSGNYIKDVVEAGHDLSPPSPDHGEVKLWKNMKLTTSSPKAVTDHKWDTSESTTPNLSAQSAASQI